METSEGGSSRNFRQKIIGEIKENPIDYILGTILAFSLGIVLYQRIILGWTDWQPWTGIGSFLDIDGKVVPGKTLWDLLELLLIPLGGAYIAFRFSKTLKKNEQKIADARKKAEQELSLDQQREAALQSYIDSMTELLLRENGGLRRSNPDDDIRVVARTRTLSTLRMLDGTRKGLLLKFIYEAGLVWANNEVIRLEGGDLSEAYLAQSVLQKVCLRGVNLMGANLCGADLMMADLVSANLERANLPQADLGEANLNISHLEGANLQGAYLVRADLQLAHLEGAHLERAHMKGANLQGAYLKRTLLIDATMPDGKKYDPEIHTIESLTA